MIGFLNKIKHGLGKAMEVGGNVARKIGEFGGQVASKVAQHGTLIGTAGGALASALTGNPALALKGAQIGSAVQQFAGSRPVQNTIRGVQDVGKTINAGGQLMR